MLAIWTFNEFFLQSISYLLSAFFSLTSEKKSNRNSFEYFSAATVTFKVAGFKSRSLLKKANFFRAIFFHSFPAFLLLEHQTCRNNFTFVWKVWGKVMHTFSSFSIICKGWKNSFKIECYQGNNVNMNVKLNFYCSDFQRKGLWLLRNRSFVE